MTEKKFYDPSQQYAEQLRHLSVILDSGLVDKVRSALEAPSRAPQLPPLKPATVYVVDVARLVAGVVQGIHRGQQIFVHPAATEHSQLPLDYWQTLAIQVGLTAEMARNTDPRQFVKDYFAILGRSGEQAMICITDFDHTDPVVQQEMVMSATGFNASVVVLSEQQKIRLPKSPRFSLRKPPLPKLEYLNTPDK